jgi:hypothetical protein
MRGAPRVSWIGGRVVAGGAVVPRGTPGVIQRDVRRTDEPLRDHANSRGVDDVSVRRWCVDGEHLPVGTASRTHPDKLRIAIWKAVWTARLQ